MTAEAEVLEQVPGFHEDPGQSYTLPGRYYHDPAVFQQEKPAIFYRTWQYVGHISRLSAPGDYLVREIGEQSVVVLRDGVGALRAFHNVCQHRAHRLLEGRGQLRKTIVCPYHAWVYDLSGELRNARGSEKVAGFDKAAFCLKKVQLDSLCGFLFVNLDPAAAPLSEAMAGLEAEIRSFSPDPERFTLAYRTEYPIKANWKNSVENFSECYHCPNQHKSLTAGALDVSSYRITVQPGYHSHRSRDKGTDLGYAVDPGLGARPQEFGSWLLWPNTSLEVYPGGGLNIFHHVPIGPEETLQVVEWYFPKAEPTAAEQELIDFVAVVREEDLPICERVQRGLHSLGYGQGRFIVDPERSEISEHAVHDFQAKVLRALSA